MLPHLFTETHTSDTKAGELDTRVGSDRLDFPRNRRGVGCWTPIWNRRAYPFRPGGYGHVSWEHPPATSWLPAKTSVGGRCIKESAARWTVRCFRDSSVSKPGSRLSEHTPGFQEDAGMDTENDIPRRRCQAESSGRCMPGGTLTVRPKTWNPRRTVLSPGWMNGRRTPM